MRLMNLVRIGIAALAIPLAVFAPPLPAQPLLHHVHGLAFSPDGKTILVPSHFGLTVFRDGSWADLNGPIHDFAGFSATEKALYASGHPPAGTSLPDPLGLVRSTDGGKTWQVLALGGEVDFHQIAAGYRSGAIYVLSEGRNSAMPRPGLHLTLDEAKTWRRAAANGLSGEILRLAAHPREAASVAAATDKGLFLSRDAGETFRRIERWQAATAVAFAVDGAHLMHARATERELVFTALETGKRSVMRLPRFGLDYVTHIAQSPADPRAIAIATDRRHVYVSADRGVIWRQIARDGDLP